MNKREQVEAGLFLEILETGETGAGGASEERRMGEYGERFGSEARLGGEPVHWNGVYY